MSHPLINARHNLISKIPNHLSDYISCKLKISFTHKIMALNEPSNTKYLKRAIMRKKSMRMRPFLKYHSLKICLSKNEHSLYFETFSWAPIDRDLINLSLLNDYEKKWMND